MGRSRTRKSRVGASAAGIALVSAALLAIAVLKARETPVGARAPTGERAVEIAAPAPVARECPAVSLSSGASEARPARSPAIGPLAREHDETGPKAASPSTVDEIAALLERADSPGFAAALEKLKLSLADAKPALVRELLERFGKTDDPLLLSAIAEALDPSGLARSEVRSALLTFAESDPSVARRVAAIAALGHAVPDDGTTERLARLASSDRTGEVRAQAAQALGDVLARDLDRAPALNGKLLEIASRDDDSSVRYAAISSLRPHEADASQVAALAETFTKESDLAPRQAAAEQLGDV
ncbi:HEAT repeat domain-containing protein, partial [bacterium]|nr:HEAT repeat domain-containing protein [bacterium]